MQILNHFGLIEALIIYIIRGGLGLKTGTLDHPSTSKVTDVNTVTGPIIHCNFQTADCQRAL